MRLAERLPYLAALAAAGLFLSQALRLEYFGPFGPGAGIFPQIATGIATALALLLLLVPALGRGGGGVEPAQDADIQPEELRTFRFYIAGMVLMVVGAAWLGFFVTCVLLALAITWQAERRPLPRALAFGAICGVVGSIGLGRYLEIELPYTAVDSWLRSLVR